MHRYSLILICIFILSSCIQGSFKGLTVGYKNSNKEDIILLENFDDRDSFHQEKIYSVNAQVLLTELKKYDKSLIYFWSPTCHSDVCIPLQSAQKICNEENVELFVVLDYYDTNSFNLTKNLSNPILAKDHHYYKTKFANKLDRRFRNQLINAPAKDTLDWYRFFYFENDKFVQAKKKYALKIFTARLKFKKNSLSIPPPACLWLKP